MDVKGEVTHKEGILFFSSSDEEIDNTQSNILFFDNYKMVDKTLLHKLFSLQIDWFATILYLSMNINIITAFSVTLIKASDCN